MINTVIHDVLWDTLEGIFAYEEGFTDSGIHDPLRRSACAKMVDAMSEKELRLSLSRWVREKYLSEEALLKGYGWECALSFLQWIEDGEYRV